jgi:spermidine/putrescine transport system substrate-binding protein
VIPEEGSDLWVDTMVVLKSSENKEAAHAFLNYVLAAENQQAVAELVLYKVPNQASMELLDPAARRAVPEPRDHPRAELLAGEQLLDLGEAQAEVTELVTRVVAS